jgi:hypothetical protein
VAGDNVIALIKQDRVRKAELLDAPGNLPDLCFE